VAYILFMLHFWVFFFLQTLLFCIVDQNILVLLNTMVVVCVP
jgi:hypothetical protein